MSWLGDFAEGVVSYAVDIVTLPASLVVKGVTGKTIGDYVTGNDRPPSVNGFLGNLVSFGTDMIPVVRVPSMLTKAVTGNTIGDYVTGDTDADRTLAQNSAKEVAKINERATEREAENAQRAKLAPVRDAGVTARQGSTEQPMVLNEKEMEVRKQIRQNGANGGFAVAQASHAVAVTPSATSNGAGQTTTTGAGQTTTTGATR